MRDTEGRTNVLKKSKRQRPWKQYDVSIAIPHLDTPEILELSIRAWQLQIPHPYIIVVDTGSESQNSHDFLRKLQQVQGVEVACLNIWTDVEHTSDRVSIAMDYCFSRCPTEFLLSTHVDVFPVHREVVENLRLVCGPDHPVVGWEMSPRGNGDGSGRGYLSDGFPGHACTMFHIPTMDRIGAGWTIRRAHHLFGLPRGHTAVEGWRWPDTEVCLGRLLQASGIKPVFLGRETNNDNQLTKDWLHARSMTVHSLINGELLPRHEQALQMARQWISEWEREDMEDTSEAAPPYVSVLGVLRDERVTGGPECPNGGGL